MFFFFLFVILLSCSIVTAEDITDNILTNEYQNHNDTSRTINFDDSEGLSNQEDTYSKYYFATESEMDSVDVSLTEEDKDEKLCTDFNQNKDDIYSNDAGLVFFDEDVINYSSIDEKYISVRNYYSNVSFTVEEIGFSAKYLLSYINSNQRLPATVNVTDVPVNMNDFLYLMCKTLNTTENVDFINFNHVFSTTGTNKPGLRLSKKLYKINLMNIHITHF